MPSSFIHPKEQLQLVPFYVFISVLVLLSLNNSFFWDKDILNSRQAYWFYEHGLNILPPNDIDSGHPPILSYLLAIGWRIFNVHLWVGHLLMLPFALGMVWQFYRFLSYFFKSAFVNAVLLLIILDTTLLTQVIVLTGDLITVFFFFLSVNTILYNRRGLLTIALVGLSLSSSRGMMLFVAMGMFDFYLLIEQRGLTNIIRRSASIFSYYLPAIIFTSWFLLYHYYKRGWIGYDPVNSKWAGCYTIVGLNGFIRNIIIVVWRMVDFGRLFLWIIGAYLLILILQKKIELDRNQKLLFAIFLISLIVSLPPMLIYKVMASHRYLLPVFIVFTALIAYPVLEKLPNKKLSKILYFVILLGLVSGNFWIYPDNIAKGWDATLAHVPYYKLRKDMIHFIDDQKIPFSKVGTEVPNISELKYIDLSNDERAFSSKDFEHNEYIFYSNIYNMFTNVN